MRLGGPRPASGRVRAEALALTTVFVDTSAWYALADGRDPHHHEATALISRLPDEGRTLVTSNHVVGESYTLMRRRLGAIPALGYLRGIRATQRVQVVFVLQQWEEAAVELLAHYVDQDFSFVDATSFVAMQRLGIREAIAFDHHFATAGFSLYAG